MATNFDNSSDAELVRALSAAHEAALEEVYRRHGGTVFGLSLRILQDRQLAEEVVQDVFVRLWRSPSGFDPERGSLRSFLCAQAHSRSVDLIRAEESRRARQERDAVRTSPTSDVESAVTNALIAEQIRSLVDSLPASERRAIEMAYFQGLTYLEVAQQLEEPEGTIKSRIRNGLRTLHARLERIGYAHGEFGS